MFTVSAKGEAHAPILLTAAEVETQVQTIQISPSIRLVDGPSPLTGRLQIFYRKVWRSVCTNSRKYVYHEDDVDARAVKSQR